MKLSTVQIGWLITGAWLFAIVGVVVGQAIYNNRIPYYDFSWDNFRPSEWKNILTGIFTPVAFFMDRHRWNTSIAANQDFTDQNAVDHLNAVVDLIKSDMYDFEVRSVKLFYLDSEKRTKQFLN